MCKKFVILVLIVPTFSVFGIMKVGRNTPFGQQQQVDTTKRSPRVSSEPVQQELPNIHMPHKITPPDRHAMTSSFMHKNRRDVFAEIYHTNFWVGEHSRSGKGADLHAAQTVRQELSVLCQALKVHTILDVGCGDHYWMQTVDLHDAIYIGVDIVPEMIALNRSHFGDEKHHFLCLDAVTDPLPEVDLVILRDVLAHLAHEEACQVLRNIKASGSKWVLMTTHLNSEHNRAIHAGHHYPCNLMEPPFNLTEPLVLFEETSAEPETRAQGKAMGLYRCADLDLDDLDY